MMNIPLYPIGIQTFSEMRENGYLYVDKTEYLYRLTTTSKYVFLSRPRRFGKSLTLSTIEAMFSGRRDLFEGLAINHLKREWEIHPVLHLDFTGSNYESSERLRNKLNSMFKKWEDMYDIIPDDYDDFGVRFGEIIQAAHRCTGRKAVILIDEYDKPLLESVEDTKLQEYCRNELRAIYGNLKGQDPHIRFAMLTGVTRFGHLSIFSDLNNLEDISLNEDYSGICGVTDEEMHNVFDAGIGIFAKKRNMSTAKIYEELKRNYDGYHFSPENALDIYNPFSLLNALKNYRFDDYWFRSGTPTFLIRMIKDGLMPLQRLSDFKTSVSSLSDVAFDLSNYISILYQSGYLTIKGYDCASDIVTLGYPNMEVERGFLNCLIGIYTPVARGESEFAIHQFVSDMREGRADDFMRRLQSFFSDFQYDSFDLKNLEQHYQDVVYIVAKLMGFNTHVEYRTASGRIDLLVKTDRYIYLFEFKIDRPVKEAIDQIDRNQYLLPFNADGRSIVKIGATFSSAGRTIDDWIIEV